MPCYGHEASGGHCALAIADIVAARTIFIAPRSPA
jgi:hypothetical protein